MAKETSESKDGRGIRVALVASEFNYDVTWMMVERAKEEIQFLGAVIEGETDHDQVVMNQAARKLTDLSVEFGKPLGLGVSGPGETRLQAQDRIENAANAVRAVVKMTARLREIRGG